MVQYSTRRAEQVLRVVLVALPATRATNKTKHLLRDAAAKGRTAQTAGSLQTLHDSGQDKRHALRVRRARENLARGRGEKERSERPRDTAAHPVSVPEQPLPTAMPLSGGPAEPESGVWHRIYWEGRGGEGRGGRGGARDLTAVRLVTTGPHDGLRQRRHVDPRI